MIKIPSKNNNYILIKRIPFCFQFSEKLFSYVFFVDFYCLCDDNKKKIFLIVNTPSDTFDYFVDDLVDSDVDLLKGELDFLLFQYLFNSIDLKVIKTIDSKDKDSLVA